VFALLASVFFGSSVAAQLTKASNPAERRVPASFGNIPLSFEPNVGQTDSQVRFLSRGDGYTLFLTSQEAVLSLKKPASKPRGEHTPSTLDLSKLSAANGKASVLAMKLVGASADAPAEGVSPLPGRSNYFQGLDRTQWHTDVPNYSKVRFHDVYPGIDLVYYGNQRQMEYDFVVSPAGNPSSIRLQFEGQDKVKVDASGDLVVTVSGENLRFRKPEVYQLAEVANPPAASLQHHMVRGAWTPEGNGSVHFEIGEYNRRQPLVIDPVLVYSTYLGGTGSDYGTAIALDSSGSVYVTGYTTSADFPVSSGVFQRANGGTSVPCVGDCEDVFVTKLNATGTAIVYSTYLGGSSDDLATAVAVDSTGNAFITGSTSSLNFPTTPGAFQTTCKGCSPPPIRR
jgi:hypothetical protein